MLKPWIVSTLLFAELQISRISLLKGGQHTPISLHIGVPERIFLYIWVFHALTLRLLESLVGAIRRQLQFFTNAEVLMVMADPRIDDFHRPFLDEVLNTWEGPCWSTGRSKKKWCFQMLNLPSNRIWEFRFEFHHLKQLASFKALWRGGILMWGIPAKSKATELNPKSGQLTLNSENHEHARQTLKVFVFYLCSMIWVWPLPSNSGK